MVVFCLSVHMVFEEECCNHLWFSVQMVCHEVILNCVSPTFVSELSGKVFVYLLKV